MLNPLYLKCDCCGEQIKKVGHFSDIFDIKKGKRLYCSHCGSAYTINSFIAKTFKIYYFFVWGFAPLNFLLIIYVLGVFFNIKGLYTLVILSVIVYYLIEALSAILLPLYRANDKDK